LRNVAIVIMDHPRLCLLFADADFKHRVSQHHASTHAHKISKKKKKHRKARYISIFAMTGIQIDKNK
jgi:hypothetical protein